MITINEFNFPIYGTIIIISLFIGLLFNYIYLKNNNIEKRRIMLFLYLLFIYSFLGGIIINEIINFNNENYSIGLSSYGGAIGVLISAIIFEKMNKYNGVFFKSSTLSLPLIYSFSKIACFFAGCCYGIPYNGLFNVIYTEELNISLFPIQLVETITFFVIFLVCYCNKSNKYIIPTTMLLSALSKFILDFFRYSHLNKSLSANQIISIIFVIISIELFLKERKLNKTLKKG